MTKNIMRCHKPNCSRKPCRRILRLQSGFTLVELLVVITIIGILIALLLPAVQAAREAARRMQCQNNLKQIGLAVLNYESQNKTFPPSSCWAANVKLSDGGPLVSDYRANWVIFILPFLDQQSLYDQFDLSVAISGNSNVRNAKARAVQIPTMLCPTDSNFNRKAFSGANSAASGLGDNWARGNYAANAALGFELANVNIWCYAGGPKTDGWKLTYLRGVMGANCAVKMAEIVDGTSNTCMLGEIRAGVATCDSRGVWALGGGSSALWGHGGVVGDDSGPNNPGDWSDDVVAFDDVVKVFGSRQALVAEGMPGGSAISNNDQQTMRSLHPGGVNSCFCDGSVHWLGDYIQVKPSDPSTSNGLSVWDRLMCSADGQVVNSNAY